VQVIVVVDRRNVRESATVSVDYNTEDGTAKQKIDYVAQRGTLQFGPNDSKKIIHVEVIDNDIYEEDQVD